MAGIGALRGEFIFWYNVSFMVGVDKFDFGQMDNILNKNASKYHVTST